jgi:hypothetical protein
VPQQPILGLLRNSKASIAVAKRNPISSYPVPIRILILKAKCNELGRFSLNSRATMRASRSHKGIIDQSIYLHP